MEEKNWIITLSDGKILELTEETKNLILKGIEEKYKWLTLNDLTINVYQIVLIYKKERENK